MSDLQNEISSRNQQPPSTEKFELLEVLWESLEADPQALTDEQLRGTRLSRCQVSAESFGCRFMGSSQGGPA
jgi:hypothetical protein